MLTYTEVAAFVGKTIRHKDHTQRFKIISIAGEEVRYTVVGQIEEHLCNWRALQSGYIICESPKETTHDEVAALYPHACPRCTRPAYVGLTRVDCSANCQSP